ncbi:DUF4352 domain-containing protein [Nocardia sp. NPDC001965]
MTNPHYPSQPQQPYGTYPQPQLPKKKAAWPWLLLIPAIFLLCGFGGCVALVANSDDVASSASEGLEDGAAAAAPDADSDIAPAGSPVRDGKFEFQVTKVEQGQEAVSWSSLVQREAQGQFVLVQVTVTNIANQAQYYFGQNQKLIDQQGREFENDTLAEAYVNEPGGHTGEINPGNKIDVVLVFDVAKDAVPTTIEFHDSAFSGGAQVALK